MSYRQNKYGNKKYELDGLMFDSKKEALRYSELKLLEKGKVIENLKLQVPFELVPSQKDENGKVIERSVKYIADFTYEINGKTVVEDTKGMKTPEYIIKRKLMLYLKGIRIKEV